jgi:hypothetical protein
MKICLWVFEFRGFEGGIRVPKHGGPLNSTRAGLLNHQTSRNSINSFWMKISLRVFKIRGLESGIGIPKHQNDIKVLMELLWEGICKGIGGIGEINN